MTRSSRWCTRTAQRWSRWTRRQGAPRAPRPSKPRWVVCRLGCGWGGKGSVRAGGEEEGGCTASPSAPPNMEDGGTQFCARTLWGDRLSPALALGAGASAALHHSTTITAQPSLLRRTRRAAPSPALRGWWAACWPSAPATAGCRSTRGRSSRCAGAGGGAAGSTTGSAWGAGWGEGSLFAHWRSRSLHTRSCAPPPFKSTGYMATTAAFGGPLRRACWSLMRRTRSRAWPCAGEASSRAGRRA